MLNGQQLNLTAVNAFCSDNLIRGLTLCFTSFNCNNILKCVWSLLFSGCRKRAQNQSIEICSKQLSTHSQSNAVWYTKSKIHARNTSSSSGKWKAICCLHIKDWDFLLFWFLSFNLELNCILFSTNRIA